MTSIGAHVHREDPFAEATACDAAVAQFFLGDPQDWKAPVFPGDPAALRDAFAQAGIDVYVHAPYRINVATANNRIRIPSRKLLGQHLEAAATIGARGLVVHGGHVDSGVDPAEGYENWRKAVERIDRPVPMLIENTAGGDRAMARGLDAVARLWDAISAGLDDNIGFCLDTCHAFAGGEELDGIVDRVKAITGRIDLVHCNNSRDERGSGRDRHAGLTEGTIDPALLLGVVRACGAPAVCETPDPATDIRWLCACLGRKDEPSGRTG
jgi:deoxyribonuclease IV